MPSDEPSFSLTVIPIIKIIQVLYSRSVNKRARDMKFRSFDSREGVEHNSVGFVVISKIFTTQDALFFERKSFVRV